MNNCLLGLPPVVGQVRPGRYFVQLNFHLRTVFHLVWISSALSIYTAGSKDPAGMKTLRPNN